MATKGESSGKSEPSGKKTTTRKTAAKRVQPASSASIVVRDAAELETKADMADDPALRRELVAMEAYFLAERRGFAAGHEMEDWIAAERVVESRQSAVTAEH